MPNVDFMHKRSPSFANCGADKICQVVLTGTSPVKNANIGDSLDFKRVGPDNNKGFEVTIDGFPSNPYVAAAGTTEISIPIGDTIALGNHEYKIYYKNDTGYIVAPLDPIIIINPTPLNPLIAFFKANLIGLVIGIVAGLALARFFFS